MNSKMIGRLVPVAILVLGLAAFLILGLDRYLSFEMLARHHATLNAWVQANTVAAVLIFVLGYTLVVAFSLPIAALLTPLGGYVFGPWIGAVLSVVSATLGATAVFLAARTAFRDLFRARAGSRLAKLEEGFARNDFNYLLFLRLVPVFPFWLINVVSALLGMRLDRFVLATLIGIIPGAIVFSGLGDGLGMLLEKGEKPNLGIIFEWRILLPLLGFAVLALLPVAYN
ncbi:MAG TPA: TVP38/TMEM64 family protein, partial [Reyranellaceae bacterium]|nr:TVP38/TMEM64 family protein [Reyranellaceae bacterium]